MIGTYKTIRLLRIALTGLCFSYMASDQRAAGQSSEQVIFSKGVGDYADYRIPSLVVTPNETMLAICEGRKNGLGDAGNIDVIQRRSVDGGQTWSEPTVVWDDAANTCGNPCPVIDQTTGTIWMLLTWNAGEIPEAKIGAGFGPDSRRVYVTHSSDTGLSWAQPVDITSSVKQPSWTWYATGPGAGIQLQFGAHAGRLLIPCDHKVMVGDRESYRSHIIYSDDHGVTWQIGAIAPRDQVNECEAVELVDGTVLLNMRNYDRARKTRQIAFSHDGGITLTDQRHDKVLNEPICQASIRRITGPSALHPHGIIAFSNPASVSERENMTLRFSFDDAATWVQPNVIHKGSSAYSCLGAMPNGTVACLYERDNYSKIALAMFPTPELAVENSN